MEEKNLARMKCINRRTRTNQTDCTQKRKTTNFICKRKKKEWLNDKIKQIEEVNRKKTRLGNSIKTIPFSTKNKSR